MIQMFIILEISRHPNGTWLMYLSESTSNVLKFIYGILVSINDEIFLEGMTHKNLQLT